MPLLLGGCGDGDQPDSFRGTRVWESEHFRYHSYADDASVCEDVLARLEQHFADTQAYLGMPWRAGDKVSYFKYPSDEELARSGKCQAFAAACSSGLNVYTTQPAHAHELIHAYFNADGHDRIPFLDEGLAEVMSCETAKQANPPPWREVVTREPDPERMVGLTGAWFVGHLLWHYPREQFLRWDARVERGASLEKIASEFEAAYGVSLDSMWQEVTDFAGLQIECVFLDECGAAALPLDGSSSAVGASCDGGKRFRSIEITEPTNLVLQQDQPWLTPLSRCDDVPTTVAAFWSPSSPEPVASMLRLQAGKYTFGVPTTRLDTQIQVRARSAPELGFSRTCDDTTAFAFDDASVGPDGNAALTLPAADVGDTWFLRIAPVAGKSLLVENGSDALTTTQCAGCSDSCEPTKPRAAMPLDAAGAATLRIERVQASASPLQILIVQR